jgi:hypothetical protein
MGTGMKGFKWIQFVFLRAFFAFQKKKMAGKSVGNRLVVKINLYICHTNNCHDTRTLCELFFFVGPNGPQGKAVCAAAVQARRL